MIKKVLQVCFMLMCRLMLSCLVIRKPISRVWMLKVWIASSVMTVNIAIAHFLTFRPTTRRHSSPTCTHLHYQANLMSCSTSSTTTSTKSPTKLYAYASRKASSPPKRSRPSSRTHNAKTKPKPLFNFSKHKSAPTSRNSTDSKATTFSSAKI